MSEFTKALQYLEKPMKIWKYTLATDHPDVFCLYCNIEWTYYSKWFSTYESFKHNRNQ